MFHEPNATRNGIMAALLARENVRGSETALEGDAGFYTGIPQIEPIALDRVRFGMAPTVIPVAQGVKCPPVHAITSLS
jgi:hypothetical protein